MRFKSILRRSEILPPPPLLPGTCCINGCGASPYPLNSDTHTPHKHTYTYTILFTAVADWWTKQSGGRTHPIQHCQQKAVCVLSLCNMFLLLTLDIKCVMEPQSFCLSKSDSCSQYFYSLWFLRGFHALGSLFKVFLAGLYFMHGFKCGTVCHPYTFCVCDYSLPENSVDCLHISGSACKAFSLAALYNFLCTIYHISHVFFALFFCIKHGNAF